VRGGKNPYAKGVWFTTKRLADGRTVRYGYFGRGRGAIPLGREATAEFHANLAEALSQAPADGTVAALIHAYRQSRAFVQLRPRTRADYLRHLDVIGEEFGKLSLRAMASPRMAKLIEDWRDDLAASPRQADYAATVLKLLLAWGVKRGLLAHNRAAGLEKIYKADRSEKVWSADELAAVTTHAAEPIQRALILALETGVSQGDLLRLTWSADQGDIITGRRAKTGVAFAVPVSPLLRKTLDAAPRGDSLTILTRADGRPWDVKGNGLRDGWRLACKAAGITGLRFNDLRGTFITRRREMGWTAEQVALCSGHPVAGEKGAQGAYANRKTIAEANARRLHKAHYAPKARTKSANRAANRDADKGDK
jgi:integrase